MDVPINLTEDSTFVAGVEELRQDLYLLLKEPIGSWYQSASTGSHVMLHSSDDSMLRSSVQDTLKQLQGIKVESVQSQDGYVQIRLNYNGRELEQVFNVND